MIRKCGIWEHAKFLNEISHADCSNIVWLNRCVWRCASCLARGYITVILDCLLKVCNMMDWPPHSLLGQNKTWYKPCQPSWMVSWESAIWRMDHLTHCWDRTKHVINFASHPEWSAESLKYEGWTTSLTAGAEKKCYKPCQPSWMVF